ncbi:hypothetical protein IHE49_00020 [Rhodanobacter sp. 7MK24]|uniref:hypothetical protein n=1 Tax=Rhodanobacter sp. 7MK24 TaxID=2775922 RepID=UPI00177EAE98|nr:hypothetical protein [Rhodanobacter sp. 7MK24]MBD8878859.1 hypothetical protein [Rhodanobacter sp. 7MK24]
MKQFDVIRVTSLRDDRFKEVAADWQRAPAIGDVGTILEVYADAFEVECSDSSNGYTIWLAAMYPDEITNVPR